MEWISVKDQIPDFDIKVLAYDNQRIYIAFRSKELDYNEHWTVSEPENNYPWGCTGAVTHWMPLPETPS